MCSSFAKLVTFLLVFAVRSCVVFLDGTKHQTMIVVRWSKVIVKMSITVIIIDDRADKLLLQRKRSKPNVMPADGKTIRPVMTVIPTMNLKGAC